MQNCTITRLETYSDKTFVRIDTDKPVYAERFIPIDEVLEDAVADMIVSLQDQYDNYVAPEAPTIASDDDREKLQTSITPEVLSEAQDRANQGKNTEPPITPPIQ